VLSYRNLTEQGSSWIKNHLCLISNVLYMKKKYFKYVIIMIFVNIVTLSSFRVYNSSNNSILGTLLYENIEALAQTEQPDINDCIPSDDWNCIALHPTDPSKDKERVNAMWPS